MRKTSLALVATIVALAAVVAGPTLAASDSSQATTMKVTMTEFKFAFAPKTGKKGAVTLVLKNAGKLPHDIRIAGKKSKLIAAGKSGTLTLAFGKAGSYAYLCTIPGHAAGGMKGTLKVL